MLSETILQHETQYDNYSGSKIRQNDLTILNFSFKVKKISVYEIACFQTSCGKDICSLLVKILQIRTENTCSAR